MICPKKKMKKQVSVTLFFSGQMWQMFKSKSVSDADTHKWVCNWPNIIIIIIIVIIVSIIIIIFIIPVIGIISLSLFKTLLL